MAYHCGRMPNLILENDFWSASAKSFCSGGESSSNPSKSIIFGDASKFQYPGVTLSPLRERSTDNIISNLRPSESPRYDLTEIGIPANGLRLSISTLTSSSETFRGAISASNARFLAFNSWVSFSAEDAWSIASLSASVCRELSSSSNLAYSASRTELSDSYNHSAETPATTSIGNKRVFLDSFATKNNRRLNSIGYISQYMSHNFLISFQYSPIRPTATTRDAAAIADLSQVINSSSEDRSMPESQHTLIEEEIIRSSIRKDKIIIIVLVMSALSAIAILIYDSRRN